MSGTIRCHSCSSGQQSAFIKTFWTMSPLLITGLGLLFALVNLAYFPALDSENCELLSRAVTLSLFSFDSVVFFASFSLELNPKCQFPSQSSSRAFSVPLPAPSPAHSLLSFLALIFFFSCFLSPAAWLYVSAPCEKEDLIPKSLSPRADKEYRRTSRQVIYDTGRFSPHQDQNS